MIIGSTTVVMSEPSKFMISTHRIMNNVSQLHLYKYVDCVCSIGVTASIISKRSFRRKGVFMEGVHNNANAI